MRQNKVKASLSGIHSILILVGGWNDGVVNNCDKYLLKTNKWKQICSLREGRYQAGCCILSSKRAFVICGITGVGEYARSIESINLDSQQDWRSIEFNHKISQTYNFSALSYKGRIIIFGGTRQSTQKVCIINEEGQLVEDLSRRAVMAGHIVKGSILVQRGRVYGVGCRKKDNEWTHQGQYFNGTKWFPI